MRFVYAIILILCGIVKAAPQGRSLVAQPAPRVCPAQRPPHRAPAYLRPFTKAIYKLFGVKRSFTHPPNNFPQVTSLELFRDVVDGDPIWVMNIVTDAVDADDDVLVYNYDVTAGKIIGRGAHVKWDLTDTGPGTYSVRVWVDDGFGDCGKSLTRVFNIPESRYPY